MKLSFRKSNGKLKVIAEPTSKKECKAAIKLFLDDHGLKRSYSRTWADSNTERKIYDVGSWSEGFKAEMNENGE